MFLHILSQETDSNTADHVPVCVIRWNLHKKHTVTNGARLRSMNAYVTEMSLSDKYVTHRLFFNADPGHC